MALFDQPLAALERLIAAEPRWQRSAPAPLEGWRAEQPQVVLRQATGLELGSSSSASLSLLLWQRAALPDEILTLGPDLHQADSALPLAQVVVARVADDTDEPYGRFSELRQASYSLGLRGVMLRTLPSRQSIWCRVDRASLEAGISLRLLGSALIAAVRALPFVESARVLLVTERQTVERLRPLGDEVLDIVTALTRMHEEQMELDCAGCEYEAVCDAVDELRQIHTRLQEER